MNILTEAWTPDLPVSDEVEKAMQELSIDVSRSDGKVKITGTIAVNFDDTSIYDRYMESEAMLPWFLTEQAY